ncbi:methyltransferase [Novipirellula caenicola]|uniref:3-hydroxy-5-methyl-1-naphthoate 3-O-methyltransferase n=1 Tax=Novipirellula caenicola TaxID=1536901 RepID=A0ABP9VWD5_9BACT
MNEPNPVIIFETLNAFQRTGALKAAIELKVFTALGAGPLDANSLATACGTSVRGMRILCDYLTVIGFLEKAHAAYSLTPTAAVFLDQNSPHYMGSVAGFVAADEIMDTYRDVTGAVRHGGTLLPGGGSTHVDFSLWVEFAKTMAPMMKPAADFIANLVAEKHAGSRLRVLDVAAGHGMFGITIAEQMPDAEIVAQDYQRVLAVAEQNADIAGVQDRYTLLPGDAMSVDFGSDYDFILLTNFLHHFGVDTCNTLLKKVRFALKPQGAVILLDFIPNEDRVSPPTAATFALTMLMSTDQGDAYTFAEYKQMLTAAGFSNNQMVDVPNSPSRLVISSNA